MKVISKEILSENKPKWKFDKGLNLQNQLRLVGKEKTGHPVYEFIGTDTFSDEWNERRRYEVEAGRDEEPQLFQPLYDVINDSSLPENVSI
jgi:hypothetical protein